MKVARREGGRVKGTRFQLDGGTNFTDLLSCTVIIINDNICSHDLHNI